MQFSHQIVLPQPVWNDFLQKLTSTSPESTNGIDLFFASQKPLQIRHSDSGTIAISENIDEDSIIAALSCDDSTFPSMAPNPCEDSIPQCNFSICLSSIVDTNTFFIAYLFSARKSQQICINLGSSVCT